MAKKVQIWLSVDQAECALSALTYASDACNSVTNESSVFVKNRLAGKLARERVDAVIAVIDEATAKALS
jgi:hypothetical protein